MNTSILCRHCLFVFSTGSGDHCPICESSDLLRVSSAMPVEMFLCEDTETASEYYTGYPFGEVLTQRIRREGSAHSHIRSRQYETDPSASAYSRLRRKNYPDGSHADYSYDLNGRLLTKCEPWEGGGHKVTSTFYEKDSVSDECSRTVREFILNDKNMEFFLSETHYLVTETPLGKREEMRKSAAGSPVRHHSLREWHGICDQLPQQGKLKRTRDINGIQHCYEYKTVEGDASPHGKSPLWTRTDTLMAGNSLLPGQSTRIKETFDANGNRIHLREYVHDGTEFVLVRSDRFLYNDQGQLVRTFYGNGTEHSAKWTSCGPARTVGTSGTVTEFEYDTLNHLVRKTVYGAGNRAKSYPEKPVLVIQIEYDRDGRLRSRTEIRDNQSSRTLYTWDASGRLTSKTDPEGLTTTCSWTPDELVSLVTTPTGATFITRYHASGAILYEGGTGRRARYYRYSATPSGIRKQIRLDRIDGPLESETLTNGFGELILLRQAAGPGLMKETAFAYNEKGQKVEEQVCGQAPLLLGYDALGHLSGMTRLPSGNGGTPTKRSRRFETRAIRYCRDDFDPGETAGKDESQQPLMYRKEIRTVYNEQGNPVPESKAVKISALDMQPGESQSVHLDKYGHYSVLDTSLDPETGELTSYSYIPGSPYSVSRTFLGNFLIRKKERDGRHSHYTRRFLNKEEECIAADDLGHTEITRLDRLGRKVSFTDTRGRKTTWTHDQATGHADLEATAGDIRKWVFDNRGLPLLEKSETGARFQYEHNESGNITTIHHTAPERESIYPLPEKDLIVRFFYDNASGALLRIQGLGGSTSYEYERTGQVSKIISPSGMRLEFQYTPAGELEKISFDDGTPPILYEYGETGRLRQINDAAGIHTFYYSPVNDISAEDDSRTGTRLEHPRDILGRPAGQILSKKTKIIHHLQLDYDKCSRINSLREKGRRAYRFTWHPGTGALSGIAYPHGMRKQWLPEDKDTRRSGVKYLFPHTLPPLIFETVPGKQLHGEMEEYLFRLLAARPFPDVLSTDTGTWEIRYNTIPLPTVFRQGNKRIELLYDYRGRCVEKSVYLKDILQERLCYVYSDTRLLAEFDATPGIPGESPILLCSYIWSPVSPAPLSMTLWKKGLGTRCHYLHDADGNVRGLVDDQCRLRAVYEYSETGRLSKSTGDLAEINPFRHGSSYYDEDLGLYLCRFLPAGMDWDKLPPGIPLPPSFQQICRYPFIRQAEFDKLFSEERRQNL